MPARSFQELSIGYADDSLLVAREALSEGDAVKLSRPNLLDYSSRTGEPQEVGYSGIEKQAQKISFGSATKVASLTVRIVKQGSPSDSIKIGIQADSSGSPSGTFLASFTKAASAFTSNVAFRADLDSVVTLSASTTYWVVMERTGSISGTDYYQTQAVGGFPSGQESKYHNGTSWTNSTMGLYVIVWDQIGVRKAKATTTTEANAYVGIMDEAVADGTNLPKGSLVVAGWKKKTSWGLTEMSVYYLSDTAGTLSTSSGTVSKKIGLSLGTETLVLLNTL